MKILPAARRRETEMREGGRELLKLWPKKTSRFSNGGEQAAEC